MKGINKETSEFQIAQLLKQILFNSFIHIAVINKLLDVLVVIVELVVKLNLSGILNEKNRLGMSALHIAVATRQLEVTRYLSNLLRLSVNMPSRLLLKSKACPDLLDKWGNTALHLSILKSDVHIVQMLLHYQVSDIDV